MNGESPTRRSENVPHSCFVASTEALTEEVSEVNPRIEKQMRSLAQNVGVEGVVNLDALKVKEIRERLNLSPDSEARIGAHDAARKNAAAYLREYGDVLTAGKDAFSAVTKHLGESEESRPLTEAQKEEAERFLLGDDVYESRMARLHARHGDSVPEDVKRRTIRNAFTALEKRGSRAVDESAVWRDKVGPFQRLQEKVLDRLTFSAYTPVRELSEFLAKEGSEDFLYRSAVGKSEKPLAELLKLDVYKAKLDAIPEDATPEARSEVYLSIVNALSKIVYREFPYEESMDNLAGMKATGQANCAGYALMGTLALRELNIPSAFMFGSSHAFVGVSTPDENFYFNHFQGDASRKVTDDDLDRDSVSDMKEFLDDSSRNAQMIRLSLGTPLQKVWVGDVSPHTHQETLYMYKEMEPALRLWLRQNNSKEKIESEKYMPSREVIDLGMSREDRNSVVRLVERSPEDPQLLARLADHDTDEFGDHTATAHWIHTLDKADVSKEGKKQRSFWHKLKSRFGSKGPKKK